MKVESEARVAVTPIANGRDESLIGDIAAAFGAALTQATGVMTADAPCDDRAEACADPVTAAETERATGPEEAGAAEPGGQVAGPTQPISDVTPVEIRRVAATSLLASPNAADSAPAAPSATSINAGLVSGARPATPTPSTSPASAPDASMPTSADADAIASVGIDSIEVDTPDAPDAPDAASAPAAPIAAIRTVRVGTHELTADSPHASTATIAGPAPTESTAASSPTAPVSSPVTREPSPADQLVHVIAPLRARSEGSTRLTLALRPHDLGRVDVELRFERGAIHVALRAEQASTAALLRDAVNDLRGEMHDRGLSPGELTVDEHQQRRHARDEPSPEVPEYLDDEDTTASSDDLLTDADATVDVRM